MALVSFVEYLLIFLLSGSSVDLVSFLDPQTALECLGEATDEESLLRRIQGKAEEGGPATYDEKATSTAIQNLASSSEAIRDRAREQLLRAGSAIKARIEDVAAKDPRRAEEAKKVLDGLEAEGAETSPPGRPHVRADAPGLRSP